MKREAIEWCDVWIPGADDATRPKVLLIGDSIVRSYYDDVERSLRDTAYCARLATSKCVGDPAFDKELALVLEQSAYAVVHFNNGLHGRRYSEKTYGRHLPRTIRFIKSCAPGATLIWASTTPVRKIGALDEYDEFTDRVRERNRMALECAAAAGIPVNDLFAVVEDHPEYYAEDGVHFNPAGRAALGTRVAEIVRRHVAGGCASNGENGASDA